MVHNALSGQLSSKTSLFDEPSGELLYVHPMGARNRRPSVSDPERALFELLSEVGNRQPLQEARELFESAYTLRVSALQKLLEHCTSVKTVRLCVCRSFRAKTCTAANSPRLWIANTRAISSIVMEPLENEGITPGIRQAFVVYIASHDRPEHEVLFPAQKDISHESTHGFRGMTEREVTLRSIVAPVFLACAAMIASGVGLRTPIRGLVFGTS